MAHLHFKGSVLYHHVREHGSMQADVVLATSWLTGHRKSIDGHTEESLSKRGLKTCPHIDTCLPRKPHILTNSATPYGDYSLSNHHTIPVISWAWVSYWPVPLSSLCRLAGKPLPTSNNLAFLHEFWPFSSGSQAWATCTSQTEPSLFRS